MTPRLGDGCESQKIHKGSELNLLLFSLGYGRWLAHTKKIKNQTSLNSTEEQQQCYPVIINVLEKSAANEKNFPQLVEGNCGTQFSRWLKSTHGASGFSNSLPWCESTADLSFLPFAEHNNYCQNDPLSSYSSVTAFGVSSSALGVRIGLWIIYSAKYITITRPSMQYLVLIFPPKNDCLKWLIGFGQIVKRLGLSLGLGTGHGDWEWENGE